MPPSYSIFPNTREERPEIAKKHFSITSPGGAGVWGKLLEHLSTERTGSKKINHKFVMRRTGVFVQTSLRENAGALRQILPPNPPPKCTGRPLLDSPELHLPSFLLLHYRSLLVRSSAPLLEDWPPKPNTVLALCFGPLFTDNGRGLNVRVHDSTTAGLNASPCQRLLRNRHHMTTSPDSKAVLDVGTESHDLDCLV